MSFAAVIEEVPKLTSLERRELELLLLEIKQTSEEAEDVMVCEHSAALGFAMLDEMEAAPPIP
jgi:hypothetical protein